MSNTIQAMPLRTPMLDRNGNLTRAWIIYFETLNKQAATTAAAADAIESNDLLYWWEKYSALVAQKTWVSGHSVFGNLGQLQQKTSIVNITGTTVTWVSGAAFDATSYALSDCTINGAGKWNFVKAYVDSTHLTLETAVSPALSNATLVVYTLDFFGSDKGQDQSVLTILDVATQSLTYQIAMSFTEIWYPDAAAVNAQHQGTGTIEADGVTLTWVSGAKFLKRWWNQPIVIGATTTLVSEIHSANVVLLADSFAPGPVSWALARLHACAGYDQLIVVGGDFPIYGSTGISINMRTTDEGGILGSLDTQVGISINSPTRGVNFRPRLNYGLFIGDQSGLLEGSVFYGGATATNATLGDWAILTRRGLINFGDDVTIEKTNRAFDDNNAGTVAVTNGSGNVTGTGSNFDRALIGSILTVGSDTGIIGAVTDATHLVLTAPWAGSTASGAYTIRIIWNSTISILSAHGGAYANFSGPAGTTRGFGYRTFVPTTPGATPDLNSEDGTGYFRWFMGCTQDLETGVPGIGSDFFLQRYDDAGAGVDAPIFIRRSDGVTILTGLTVIQQTAALQMNILSGGDAAAMLIGGPVGFAKTIDFATLTSSYLSRWTMAVDASAESGGNAGSNFAIARYTDAGVLIDAPISITRSTGSVYIGDLATGALSVAGDDVASHLAALDAQITGINGNITALYTAIGGLGTTYAGHGTFGVVGGAGGTVTI